MKQMNWKELPHAGTILKAGNANEYKTGSWRSLKPRWIEENCIQCLFWLHTARSVELSIGSFVTKCVPVGFITSGRYWRDYYPECRLRLLYHMHSAPDRIMAGWPVPGLNAHEETG